MNFIFGSVVMAIRKGFEETRTVPFENEVFPEMNFIFGSVVMAITIRFEGTRTVPLEIEAVPEMNFIFGIVVMAIRKGLRKPELSHSKMKFSRR